MNWIKQNWIKVGIGGLILVTLFYFWHQKDTRQNAATINNVIQTPTDTPVVPEQTFTFEDEKNGASKKITTTESIRGYGVSLTSYRDEDDFEFAVDMTISKNGDILYKTDDVHFFPVLAEYQYSDTDGLTKYFETANQLKKWAVKDITGNGIPELIFDGWSGGAHCCTTVRILELGEKLSVLWDFDIEDANADLVDINRDGISEIKTWDAAYYFNDWGGRDGPKVILSFDNKLNKYRVNLDMMRKPVPSQKELEKEAVSAEWDLERTYTTLNGRIIPWALSGALRLIYSGNAKSIPAYIDLVWQGYEDESKFATKEEFRAGLKEALQSSSYYKDILPNMEGVE